MSQDEITTMQLKSETIREHLTAFERGQNEDSDAGNEDHIYQAFAALDSLDAALDDLVP